MKQILAILFVSLGAGHLMGQDPPKQDDPKVHLNAVTLQQLTESVQRRTKKTFIYNEQVAQDFAAKKVRMYSSSDFKSTEELFAVYQTILQVNKYTMIPTGAKGEEKYTIVPQPDGQKQAPFEGDNGYIMRVFSLQFVSTNEVILSLNSIAPPQAIVPVQGTGMLIITDYEQNMKRYEEIIKAIDIKKPDMIWRKVTLRKALASDVETMLKSLLQAIVSQQKFRGGMPGVPGAEQVTVVADKRTNSVLILAEPARIDQIESLVTQLDGEAEFESSGIYMVHLKHTDSIDVSRTLNALYKISVDTNGVPTGGGGVKPNQPVGPQGQPTPGQGGGFGSGAGSSGSGGEPTIVADKRTNSLIIITDRNTYQQLARLAERLDRRRPQVLIKATVVEVRASDTFDFGVELGRATDPDGVLTTAGHSNFGMSTLVPDSTGKFFNIVPIDTPGLTLAVVKDRIGNVGALIKALKDKVKISILDEPEVATQDNSNAEIKLSSQVPVTTTTTTQFGVQETFSNFQEAVTTLSISPHISEGSYLRLETKIKIEKFAGTTTDRKIPPAKTSREIDTKSVTVPNGQTVVIGGIVTEDSSDTETSIPILGDIPILGLLFRRTRNIEERRTLYIFITPYILYDESFADLAELTKDRKFALDGMRGQQLRDLQLDQRGEPRTRSAFIFRKPSKYADEVK